MLNPEVVKSGKNNYKCMGIKKLIKSKLSTDSLDRLRFARGYLFTRYLIWEQNINVQFAVDALERCWLMAEKMRFVQDVNPQKGIG